MQALIRATFKAKDYDLVTAIIRSLGEAATRTEVIYEKENCASKVRVICRKADALEKNAK
jgi:hypothetical protein